MNGSLFNIGICKPVQHVELLEDARSIDIADLCEFLVCFGT